MALSLTNLGAYSTSSLGTLFSGSSGSSSITPIDLSPLLTQSSSVSIEKTVPQMTPWDSSAPKTAMDKLASQTLIASSLFSGGLGTGPGSGIKDKNDKELFLLYNAVNKLKSLAETASTRTISDAERAKFKTRIEKGIEEIEAQVKSNPMTNALLLSGKKYVSHVSATLGQAKPKSFYTNPLVNGDTNAIPDQFTGNVKFAARISTVLGDNVVNFDLSEMGATSRTVSNVASYINGKLAAAGVESRFIANEVVKPSNIKGIEGQKQQRFEISIADLESLSFEPVAGDSETAFMVSGIGTKDKITSGILTRIDASSTNSTEQVFQSDLAAAKANANIRALKTDSDGNTYVLSDVGGTFGGLNNKTSSNVALQKYDSTGRLVYTRALGAASSGQGFSLAIGADGQVAIAGALNGNLENSTSSTNYGKDGFVAVFDDKGNDVFSAQTKSAGEDSAASIAFDASGNLLVLGSAQTGLSGTTALGGQDLYIQSYSSSGTLNYSTSLGSSGTDRPIGIEISGSNAYIAWNNETSGFVSRIDAATGSVNAADLNTSSFGKGRIDDFTLDGNGNAIIAASTNMSAMADKIVSFNLTTNIANFTKDLAGQPIKALAANANDIAIVTEGSINIAAKNPTAVQAKLIAIASSNGADKFNREFLGEASNSLSVAIASNQSKSLQAMGLPQGSLDFDTSTELTDLTGLRAGDYFYVAANGGTQRKVTIAENETMQSLGDKLSKYLSTSASVSVLSKNGGKYFSITPKAGGKIELVAGLGTANALKQLGLDEGLAIANSTSKTKVQPPIIALDLPQTIDISTKETAKSLSSTLDGVMGRIRIGYRASSNDPTMVELRKQTSQKKTTQNSAAIAAYNSQTAAMQEALARLGG